MTDPRPLLPRTEAGMRLSDSRDHHGHNCMRTFGGPCNCSLDAAILAVEAEAAAAALAGVRREAKALREAAQAVIDRAETDDFDGDYIDWLVPDDAIAALRDAVLALLTPEPAP